MVFSSTIEELKAKLETENDSVKFETYRSLVTEYVKNGDFNSALLYANKSSYIGKKIKNKKFIGKSYNLIGGVYFYQGKVAEALKFYLRALNIFEAIQYQHGLSQTYVNLGIIHGELGEYEKAAIYFNNAVNINIKINNKNGLGYAYINLGIVYKFTGQIEKAIQVELKAIEIYKELGLKKELIDVYCSLAQFYLETKEFIKASELNKVIIEEAKQIDYVNAIMNAHANLGELNFHLNRYSESIDETNEAINLAKKSRDLRTLFTLYKNLYLTYEHIKNYKNALESYLKYIQYRDSVYNEDNTKKLVTAQMQYEFDKKEAAIKSKQAINDAIAKEKIQQQKIIIISVVLGSSLLLLALLFFINRRKTKHALEVNKLENKTLRSQLNPHFIFNALASIQKYMNEYPEKAENYLAKFGKLMREVLENSEKEYISLEEEFDMLKNYMDLEKLRVKNGFNYQFNIQDNIDVEEVKLPPLLLQPIVENAIWHGVAKDDGNGEIIINVEKVGDGIKYEIENRSEFEKQPEIASPEPGKRKSFGQQIVRERLNLLSKDKNKKCSLEISSSPNGMKVTVIIPS